MEIVRSQPGGLLSVKQHKHKELPLLEKEIKAQRRRLD
jgi:hypothetical protein